MISFFESLGHAEVAQILLENGANIEALDESEYKSTPLLIAAGYGNWNIIQTFTHHIDSSDKIKILSHIAWKF